MNKIFSKVMDAVVTDLIEEAMRKYNDSHVNDAGQDRRDYLKGYMDGIVKVRSVLDPKGRDVYSEEVLND